jgi:hypothetical protein
MTEQMVARMEAIHAARRALIAAEGAAGRAAFQARQEAWAARRAAARQGRAVL